VTGRRQVVEVEVPAVDAEMAADVLWQANPSAVAERALHRDRVLLTADVTELGPLERLPASCAVRALEIDGDAYLDAWRAWARPVRAGRRVVLHPAWLPDPEGEAGGEIVVRLDPGRAFGSGSHPSTRLVIAALEAHLGVGDRVLDVGAGSGVLSVVACLLGAARAVAVDIDPSAVEATRANAVANGVADRVEASATPVAAVSDRFDLVLANIGAGVLRDLAAVITERVADGGTLVLAGLLDEQTDQVVAAYPTLHEVARLTEHGWTAAILTSSVRTDARHARVPVHRSC
jgi:ribosomal protein L11 methyltransferase